MSARISPKPEKALREALYSVTHSEAGQIPPSLAALDDSERAEVLSLAALVTAYIMIDACGSQWPVQTSVEKIARTLAAGSTSARRLRLDPDEIYAYLSRTVLGPERLEDVVAAEPLFTRLPVIVAGQALAVYCPKEIDMWDYLDQVESAIETASALDAAVLPAAVLFAYQSAQKSPGERRSACDR